MGCGGSHPTIAAAKEQKPPAKKPTIIKQEQHKS
jgi:hypothetical protein